MRSTLMYRLLSVDRCNRALRLLFLTALVLTHGNAFAQGMVGLVPCAERTDAISLGETLPCIIGRQVKVTTIHGKNYSGRLSVRDQVACSTEAECRIQISRPLMRPTIVPALDAMSVTFRPQSSPSRKRKAWIAGLATTTALGIAFYKIADRNGSPDQALLLAVPSVAIGVSVGYWVNNTTPVTIRLRRP